jgi:hypothetical protein
MRIVGRTHNAPSPNLAAEDEQLGSRLRADLRGEIRQWRGGYVGPSICHRVWGAFIRFRVLTWDSVFSETLCRIEKGWEAQDKMSGFCSSFSL